MPKLASIAFASFVAFSSTGANADISPLRKSVIAYYAQNNQVQAAVEKDYCLHWDERAENRPARARLSRSNARAYDLVEKLVTASARATNGTDSALDQLRADFCSAADNR